MTTLDIWDPDAGDVTHHGLDLDSPAPDASVELTPLDGATAIEILLRDEGTPTYWGEVATQGRERIPVRIGRRPTGEWQVTSEAGPVIGMGLKWYRRTPLVKPKSGRGVDLAFLVDGTSRAYGAAPASAEGTTRPSMRRLVPDSEVWRAIVTECEALAHALAATGPCRWAALSFGDHPLPWASHADLMPKYVVAPEHPRFHHDVGRLAAEGLLAVRASPGADYVDALADGLHAAAELPWAPTSRKVLVVIGDSPGYSVLAPPPLLANAQTRRFDVQAEADRLHQRGVEVVTILHDVSRSDDAFVHGQPQGFLKYTDDQYAELATLPAYHLRSSTFRGAQTAGVLENAPPALAHGAFPATLSATSPR